jgi:hypothetical protein
VHTDLADARRALDEDGFALLPSYLTTEELAPAVAAMRSLYPTADEFHDDVDPERNAKFRLSQFHGLVTFPFTEPALSLLAVHERILDLSEALLGSSDIRLYRAEAWAKYTGAVDYDQTLHRDYGNHTFLVPSSDPAFRQLELFVYLDDVTHGHGPTHVVPTRFTRDISRSVPSDLSREDHPDLYAAEVGAAGPAGTMLAYTTDTFHRGTNMTAPRGARYTLHLNFRHAAAEWAGRECWTNAVFKPGWYGFVEKATPRQLALLGWPAPGHAYWTAETLAATALRYPNLDLGPWRG